MVIYSRKKALIKFSSELSYEEQSLIVIRTYNLIKVINLICFHHKSLLLAYYRHLERYCSNPFEMVCRCSLKGLRSIDLDIADCVLKLINKIICQVQKIFPSCRKALNKLFHQLCKESVEKVDNIDDIDDIKVDNIDDIDDIMTLMT